MSLNQALVPEVDLHIHTTASDGTFTPDEIVRTAKKIGLKVIAITDHDTMAGIDPATQTALSEGIELIPGFEISVGSLYGSVHILGLGITQVTAELDSLLDKIREGRRKRNPMIIRKLNIMGYSITLDEVKAIAQGDVVGRPHIAQSLINRGYVQTIAEAFDRFHGSHASAYVHRWRPTVLEACSTIVKSHGIPVLAHPGLLHIPAHSTLERYIKFLITQGIRGLEVHYTRHTQEQHDELAAIARTHDLIMTGGSDFHGENSTHAVLGRGSTGAPIRMEFAAGSIDRLKSLMPTKTLA